MLLCLRTLAVGRACRITAALITASLLSRTIPSQYPFSGEHGEDAWLAHYLFWEKRNGFYLEVVSRRGGGLSWRGGGRKLEEWKGGACSVAVASHEAIVLAGGGPDFKGSLQGAKMRVRVDFSTSNRTNPSPAPLHLPASTLPQGATNGVEVFNAPGFPGLTTLYCSLLALPTGRHERRGGVQHAVAAQGRQLDGHAGGG